MILLRDVFAETADKDRFVGDTMFWKYFEDINIKQIYHTDSIEYRNLKLMCCETIFYILLLISVTVYAYQLQSQDVFTSRVQQLDYWQGCDAAGHCRIQAIDDMQSFWTWMEQDLLSLSYADDPDPPVVANIEQKFSNSQFPMQWTPRYVDTKRTNLLLGTIRLRQLRVQKNKGCQVSKLYSHVFPNCYATFDASIESTDTYQSKYAPTYLTDAFQWNSEIQTSQVSIGGSYGSYGGGGFIVDLPTNRSEAGIMVRDLHSWDWVDKTTRAVAVEVTTMNTNVNVIVNSVILFEFSPNGAVTGSAQSSAIQIFFFTPSTQSGTSLAALVFLILLIMIFVIYTLWTLWLMYKTCFNFVGQGFGAYFRKASGSEILVFPFRLLYQFFRYGWNVADLMILLAFYAHLVFRLGVYNVITSEPNLAPNVIGHPELFMPFGKTISPLSSSNQILALLVLLCWVKLFKYLCMSVYFRLLVRILERCGYRILNFCVLLLVVNLGFAVAFAIGLGDFDPDFSTIQKSFLVQIFFLIDGININQELFSPGKDQLMSLIFIAYTWQIYFVLLNIFIAIVLDTFSLSARQTTFDNHAQNPMIVFLIAYYNWLKGHSLVEDDVEEQLKSEDLSIRLELLPGLIRKKWMEKKRRMQKIANENFAGLELFPEEILHGGSQRALTDWTMPSTQADIFDHMTSQSVQRPVELYDIPQSVLHQEVSRSQLQQLMDEDSSIGLLLGGRKAVDVIRKFKGAQEYDGAAVKETQAQLFTRLDKLEQVPLDEELPKVPEIEVITESMSQSLLDMRNQFRLQLTGIIEATAVLFEHLVELTQGIDEVRVNNEAILKIVRNSDRGH